jgi:hypothetical protein
MTGGVCIGQPPSDKRAVDIKFFNFQGGDISTNQEKV